MKISSKLIKNIDANAIIAKAKESTHILARYSAYIASNHIKESIWRDKDTQTGNLRERLYNVGGSKAEPNQTIVGSTQEEWPNIEKATLVNGISSIGSKTVNGKASIISNAINTNGENYAEYIDKRNKYLNRGVLEKRLTIINSVEKLHYLKKLK
jgi:hypothetical protein